MFAMFLYNAKLFILYYYIKSLQVVDGGSHNDNHPLKFITFSNHFQSPNYVEQRSNTTAKFSDSTPETQVPKRQREGRIWIHTFQIPSGWAKYLQNKNDERRSSTRPGSRGNLTKPFRNNALDYRRQLNNRGTNLPWIKWIPTLPLWPGEYERNLPSYINYKIINYPKTEYEAHNFSHIRVPSGIGGSRQGMTGLSGLGGDHTSTWMSNVNTRFLIPKLNQKSRKEERQKQRIRYFRNYPGWLEDVPNYGNTNKNLNTTIKPLSLHPQTKLMGHIKWFVYSPTWPAWSGDEPYFGYIQQRLDTRSQGNHGSNESSEDPRAFTRPLEVSKMVNHESNTETDQKPRIRSGRNSPMTPQIQTRRVRGGTGISSVYGQELVEVEENSDNNASLPVFIPV